MDSTISIRFADLDDINTIGFLAQQIWPPTYGDILTAEQLDYMLGLFYSPASLTRQMIDEKHSFLIVEEDETPIGFAAWSPITDKPGLFKLYKLYVLGRRQGRGMGKTIINFILDDIRERDGERLRLNVNRHNKAIKFYEKMGFSIVGEEDIDIGNGYFMNDFIMELPVTFNP
jgi:ribosomal protein S18 acetylase RimI-like enzyme